MGGRSRFKVKRHEDRSKHSNNKDYSRRTKFYKRNQALKRKELKRQRKRDYDRLRHLNKKTPRTESRQEKQKRFKLEALLKILQNQGKTLRDPKYERVPADVSILKEVGIFIPRIKVEPDCHEAVGDKNQEPSVSRQRLPRQAKVTWSMTEHDLSDDEQELQNTREAEADEILEVVSSNEDPNPHKIRECKVVLFRVQLEEQKESRMPRKRPRQAFRYKGNFYHYCDVPFCHENPKVAKSKVAKNWWSAHYKKHEKPLPCYLQSCPRLFLYPYLRDRHLFRVHGPRISRQLPTEHDRNIIKIKFG